MLRELVLNSMPKVQGLDESLAYLRLSVSAKLLTCSQLQVSKVDCGSNLESDDAAADDVDDGDDNNNDATVDNDDDDDSSGVCLRSDC